MGYRIGIRGLGIVLVLSDWKLFQVKQQTQVIRGEEVDIKDSQASIFSSISGNRLRSYRLFVPVYLGNKLTKLKQSGSVDVNLQGC